MNDIDDLFKKKADYYDEALKVFNNYRVAVYSTNLELLRWFCDFAIFTLMCSYELWILQYDYQKAIKKFQQNYYVRQTVLICFELLSDIPQHCNEHYNQLLINKIDNTGINEKANELRKIFNKIRNENEAKFKPIRDMTIAHREHDISILVETINNMDNGWIMEFALNYMNHIESLNELMNKVVNLLIKDSEKLSRNTFIEKYSI